MTELALGFYSHDPWPEIFDSRLRVLPCLSIGDALDGMDWEQLRALVLRQPASWRLALLRLWSNSLLTSARMGRDVAPCLFCGAEDSDRWQHLCQCQRFAPVVLESLRLPSRDFSLAETLGLMEKLGFPSTGF